MFETPKNQNEKEPFGTKYFIRFNAQVPTAAQDEPVPKNTDCAGMHTIDQAAGSGISCKLRD